MYIYHCLHIEYVEHTQQWKWMNSSSMNACGWITNINVEWKSQRAYTTILFMNVHEDCCLGIYSLTIGIDGQTIKKRQGIIIVTSSIVLTSQVERKKMWCMGGS